MKDNTVKIPLIILIGGYSGTGKSTLAQAISERIKKIQILPTGIIRSIIQTNSNLSNSILIETPTYDMSKLVDNGIAISVEDGFRRQSNIVTESIDNIIAFMAKERQNIIIEGNHLMPEHDYISDECKIIEIYLTVDDIDLHRKMLGGDTHDRNLSEEQVKTAIDLNKDLVSRVKDSSKPIFNQNEHEQALNYIRARLVNLDIV